MAQPQGERATEPPPRTALRPWSWQRYDGRGELLETTTREVLTIFAPCPRCGYPVQASETTRSFSRGIVERVLFRTCGLPCGWQDSATSEFRVPSIVPRR